MSRNPQQPQQRSVPESRNNNRNTSSYETVPPMAHPAGFRVQFVDLGQFSILVKLPEPLQNPAPAAGERQGRAPENQIFGRPSPYGPSGRGVGFQQGFSGRAGNERQIYGDLQPQADEPLNLVVNRTPATEEPETPPRAAYILPSPISPLPDSQTHWGPRSESVGETDTDARSTEFSYGVRNNEYVAEERSAPQPQPQLQEDTEESGQFSSTSGEYARVYYMDRGTQTQGVSNCPCLQAQRIRNTLPANYYSPAAMSGAANMDSSSYGTTYESVTPPEAPATPNDVPPPVQPPNGMEMYRAETYRYLMDNGELWDIIYWR